MQSWLARSSMSSISKAREQRRRCKPPPQYDTSALALPAWPVVRSGLSLRHHAGLALYTSASLTYLPVDYLDSQEIDQVALVAGISRDERFIGLDRRNRLGRAAILNSQPVEQVGFAHWVVEDEG